MWEQAGETSSQATRQGTFVHSVVSSLWTDLWPERLELVPASYLHALKKKGGGGGEAQLGMIHRSFPRNASTREKATPHIKKLLNIFQDLY